MKTRVGDNYPLATGAAATARLELLDRVYGRPAEAILASLGIPPGATVADIGCGTGNTSRWFARAVGPSGRVTAVDVSPDQLAVARASALAENLDNIRFVEANAYDTGLPRDAFDVVHCRLLLCHLTRPLDGLRELAAIARPGGTIVCFDLDVMGLISAPETAAYLRLREVSLARGSQRGVDYELGMKLPALFRQAGLPHADIAIIHPVYLRGEEKTLWSWTFREAKAHTLKSGILSAADFERLSGELAEVDADETVAVAQGRMPVAWARKPG